MSTKERKTREHRVTIKDVAKAAGVSIATVSYVLNNKPGQSISDETRKKVLQFANLLGYACNVVARNLATGKSNTVTVIVKDVKSISSHYYLKLVIELSRMLKDRNYELRLADYFDGMQGAESDAFITLALSESDFRSFADTKYVPVIAIDSVFDDFLFYRINDNYKKLSEAARREFGADKSVRLLTFELPDECLKAARNHFDGIDVVRTFADLQALDANACYATVSPTLYQNAESLVPVRFESASFALKASAAVGATINAVNHVIASYESHDIKV